MKEYLKEMGVALRQGIFYGTIGIIGTITVIKPYIIEPIFKHFQNKANIENTLEDRTQDTIIVNERSVKI